MIKRGVIKMYFLIDIENTALVGCQRKVVEGKPVSFLSLSFLSKNILSFISAHHILSSPSRNQ